MFNRPSRVIVLALGILSAPAYAQDGSLAVCQDQETTTNLQALKFKVDIAPPDCVDKDAFDEAKSQLESACKAGNEATQQLNAQGQSLENALSELKQLITGSPLAGDGSSTKQLIESAKATLGTCEQEATSSKTAASRFLERLKDDMAKPHCAPINGDILLQIEVFGGGEVGFEKKAESVAEDCKTLVSETDILIGGSGTVQEMGQQLLTGGTEVPAGAADAAGSNAGAQNVVASSPGAAPNNSIVLNSNLVSFRSSRPTEVVGVGLDLVEVETGQSVGLFERAGRRTAAGISGVRGRALARQEIERNVRRALDLARKLGRPDEDLLPASFGN